APAPSAPRRRVSVLAYVGLGVAAAGIGTGSVFGVMALGDRSTLDRECPAKQCPPTSQHGIERLQRDSAIATTGFTIGAIGLVTGLALIAMPGTDPSSESKVTAYFGPGNVGVRGAF